MYKHQSPHQHNPQYKLVEGLKSKELQDLIDPKFTIDQFKSKMGKDEDIIVVAFRLKEKFPAIDLMEFIEKGYIFVLDADMSTGEEKDGYYRVFVEFERDQKFPEELEKLMRGINQLCEYSEWKFRFYKDSEWMEFNKENIIKNIPLTGQEYHAKIKSNTISEIQEVLNVGTTKVIDLDNQLNVKLSKPYSGDLSFKLVALGEYKDLKDNLKGHIQLDEASNSQTLFLEKYLGNYEITKIDNKFIIKNNNKAIIIRKNDW